MIAFANRMSQMQRSFIREILKVAENPSIISFAGGLPNPRFFPVEEIAAATRAALDSDGRRALQYATTEGYPPLRQWIAERCAARGLRVRPEQILVVNGSQQALDLIAKVFIDAGDTVLVERPTYLAAIQAFGLFQPSFRSLLLEEDGVSLEELAAALDGTRPKLFYAVPNFQNPSGISWSQDKRREAARLLERSGTVLVEDDPYGELRFQGEARAPIAAHLDGSGLAPQGIYLGTFSKIVAPGLRMGWVCAEGEIMERLVVAKQAADLHSNGFTQRVLHRYLADNDIDAYIARIREAYGRQRDCMVAMVEKLFPPEVRCTKPLGGMFLWMTLPEGMCSLAMLERAIRQNVAFVPGQAFFANGGGENTLRLNFSNADEARIEEGMKRLAGVYQEMRRRS